MPSTQTLVIPDLTVHWASPLPVQDPICPVCAYPLDVGRCGGCHIVFAAQAFVEPTTGLNP